MCRREEKYRVTGSVLERNKMRTLVLVFDIAWLTFYWNIKDQNRDAGAKKACMRFVNFPVRDLKVQ